jgi:hypothetical protein
VKRLVLLVVASLATSSGVHAADKGYATLAEALASPVAFDADEAVKCHSDKVVLLRMELARQQLTALSPWPSDMTSHRLKFLERLGDAHTSLEKQREYDKTIPDYEGLAKKGLNSGPGLIKMATKKEADLTEEDKQALGELAGKAALELGKAAWNSFKASRQRDAYQTSYAALRKESTEAFNKAAFTQYKGVDKATGKSLDVQLSGSWHNTFINDLLSLRNDTGKDLTNCTILVSINGYNAKTNEKEGDSHMHYLAKWPADKTIYASYPSRANTGIATNESADSIESVTVTFFSDQCWDQIKYTYAGKDYDKDVQSCIETRVKPKFHGKWFAYDKHTFYDNGFQFWYEGDLSSFPVWFVTVTVTQGAKEKSLRFDIRENKMVAGNKRYLSSAAFNEFANPDKVVLKFEFPRSSYTYEATWNLTTK